MWDWIDDFNIKAWMIIGPAIEDFAEDEKQQQEFEQNIDEDDYDIDKNEDYS